jgi:hypothetical protein
VTFAASRMLEPNPSGPANERIGEDRQKRRQALVPEEDQHLLDLVHAEATWPLIAITIGRSVQAVQERAQKLGRPVVELGLKTKGK